MKKELIDFVVKNKIDTTQYTVSEFIELTKAMGFATYTQKRSMTRSLASKGFYLKNSYIARRAAMIANFKDGMSSYELARAAGVSSTSAMNYINGINGKAKRRTARDAAKDYFRVNKIDTSKHTGTELFNMLCLAGVEPCFSSERTLRESFRSNGIDFVRRTVTVKSTELQKKFEKNYRPGIGIKELADICGCSYSPAQAFIKKQTEPMSEPSMVRSEIEKLVFSGVWS